MEINQKNGGDLPPKAPTVPLPLDGIGIGIFALIAGALLLAEQWGLIPAVKWFLPLALLVFGAVTVARVLLRK